VADLEYRYAAGQNNGRITQMKDWVSGEEVSYSYDTLNRLIQAVTTGPQYGLNFSYDGFGNLTQEQVFKGTGYNMNLAYNGTTNRIVTAGYLYDYNGNLTEMPYLAMSYDVQNRLIQTDQTTNGTMQYGYNPGGQRVWKRNPNSENFWSIDYYGADGKLMSNCWAQFQDWDPNLQQRNVFSGACETERLYFGGKHVRTQAAPRQTDYAGVVIDWAVPVTVDRLGSAGTYYPYGEARSSPSEFATYQRDNTGLDYAQNRYYSSQIARFTTADPYKASGGPADPQSWNRYAYVGGDPVNFADPTGDNRVVVSCDWTTGLDGEGGIVPFAICGLYSWTGGGGTNTASDGARVVVGSQSRWDKAVAKLSDGNALLNTVLGGQPSEPCQGDLHALQNIGVSSVGILAVSDTVQWNNASGDDTLAIGLFVPGSQAYQDEQQHGPNETISQYVSGATPAAAALPGSALWGNIYFSSSYVAGLSTANAAALLMHELIHTLGPTDSQIQAALFGASSPQVGALSDNITQKFLKDCFQ
jgi:RHS repeat-associated protein